MVEDNNCGFWVDPKSCDDFAQKLIDISDNSELLTTYATNARNLAINKYDKSLLTNQFLEVIKTHTCNKTNV